MSESLASEFLPRQTPLSPERCRDFPDVVNASDLENLLLRSCERQSPDIVRIGSLSVGHTPSPSHKYTSRERQTHTRTNNKTCSMKLSSLLTLIWGLCFFMWIVLPEASINLCHVFTQGSVLRRKTGNSHATTFGSSWVKFSLVYGSIVAPSSRPGVLSAALDAFLRSCYSPSHFLTASTLVFLHAASFSPHSSSYSCCKLPLARPSVCVLDCAFLDDSVCECRETLRALAAPSFSRCFFGVWQLSASHWLSLLLTGSAL